MKEIKGYTPAPWQVKDCHDDTRTAEIKSGNKNIATVWAYNNGKQQIDFNEQSANAELIAAAPSLYEEKIKLREQLEVTKKAGLEWFDMLQERDKQVEVLREAIRKMACIDGEYRDADSRMQIALTTLKQTEK